MPKMFSGKKKTTIVFQHAFILQVSNNYNGSKNQAHGVVKTNICGGDYIRDCGMLRDSGRTVGEKCKMEAVLTL